MRVLGGRTSRDGKKTLLELLRKDLEVWEWAAVVRSSFCYL